MGTKLYLPSYPSMGEGGVQPAFKQSGGSSQPVFEAFEINFHDETIGNLPTIGEAAVPTVNDPIIVTSPTPSGSDLTGKKNRCCNGRDGVETEGRWAYDLHALGGADLPAIGFRVELYWIGGLTDGDGRIGLLDLMFTDVNDGDSSTGLAFRSKSDTFGQEGPGAYYFTNGAAWTGGTDDITSAVPSNYWMRFRHEYIASANTVQGWLCNINEADEATNTPRSMGAWTDPGMRWMTIKDPGTGYYCPPCIHSIWVGSLNDDFPATYGSP